MTKAKLFAFAQKRQSADGKSWNFALCGKTYVIA